jgi:hypothetical protein
MSGKDYVDHSYAGYDKQLELVKAAFFENTKSGGPWQHIPEMERNLVNSLYLEYHPLFLAAENPSRSKIDVAEREAVYKRTAAPFRSFCQRYFYDEPDHVTDVQLLSMNLRPHDKIRTSHGTPPLEGGDGDRAEQEPDPHRPLERGRKPGPLDAGGLQRLGADV